MLFTGSWIRTNALGVMSPARSLCATPVKHVALLWSSRPSPGDRFRSCDLVVMSHARCPLRHTGYTSYRF